MSFLDTHPPVATYVVSVPLIYQNIINQTPSLARSHLQTLLRPLYSSSCTSLYPSTPATNPSLSGILPSTTVNFSNN